MFIGRTDAVTETPILWLLDAKSQLTGKTLMLGKSEGQGREWQRIRWQGSITNSMDMNLSKFWEIAEDRGAWHAIVHGVAKRWTRCSN